MIRQEVIEYILCTSSPHHTPTAYNSASQTFCMGVYSGCGMVGPSLHFCNSFYGKVILLIRQYPHEPYQNLGLCFGAIKLFYRFFLTHSKKKIYLFTVDGLNKNTVGTGKFVLIKNNIPLSCIFMW